MLNNACQEAASTCHWHVRISWLDPLENGISITGVLWKAKSWGSFFIWRCVDVPWLTPCAMRALFYSVATQKIKEPCWILLIWLQIQRCSSSLASRFDSNVTLQGRKRSCILLERRVRVQYPVSQHRSDISAFQHQDSAGHWPMTVISACCSIFLGCWKVMPAWTALQPPLSPMLSSISLVIFGYTQRTRSKYALTALVTLTFSSETLLSSTGLDYDLKLAASYCWLSIHEWNPCSSEDDAHQQYSTAASLFWINKTCSSFLNSVFFSVWSLSHLYLMEEAAL